MRPKLIKIVEFKAVSFFDPQSKPEPRQIIVLYGLGSDGIVRELSSGGKWRAFPVYDSFDALDEN